MDEERGGLDAERRHNPVPEEPCRAELRDLHEEVRAERKRHHKAEGNFVFGNSRGGQGTEIGGSGRESKGEFLDRCAAGIRPEAGLDARRADPFACRPF